VLIGGKTMHNLMGISRRSSSKMSDDSDEAKSKLQSFWKAKSYFIIDEYSMVSKSFLAKLSRNVSISKEGTEIHHDGASFGGINVVLCGDLHQFPPVAESRREYLYRPNISASNPLECQIRRIIYEVFDTVVILKSNKCE
jgi:PIF1-like helicase